MTIQLSNFATSTIADVGGIAAGDLALNVSAGDGALFPSISGSDYFYCVLVDTSGNREIIKVTARSTDAFTIERAQEGTSARAFAQDDKVELRLTAATLLAAARDLNGNSLILDADGDSVLVASTDDQIDIKPAGTTQVSIKTTGVDITDDLDVDGTANLDETDIDGNVDISGTVDIGASTTRRLAPTGTFVNNANGNPNISDTTIELIALGTGTWVEIGPTGAANVWGALNSVPADADWIEVRALFVGVTSSGASGTNGIYFYARKDGGSDSLGNDNRFAYCLTLADSGTGGARLHQTVTGKIPISSRKFEVLSAGDFTSNTITLVLVGWGFNP